MNDEEEIGFDETIIDAPVIKKMSKRNSKAPPNERLSYQRQRYPGSKESDWEKFEGIGWVHKHERDYFFEYHRQCLVDKKWYRPEVMTLVIGSDNTWIHNSQLHKGWELCKLARRMACKTDEMIDALDAMGGTIKVHPWEASNYYATDEYDGRRYPKSSMIQLTGCPIEWISSYTFSVSNKYRKCASCNNNSTKDIINADHGLEAYSETPLCQSCADKIAARNIILAHDSKEYPNPKFYMLKNWRATAAGYPKPRMVEYEPARKFGCEVEVEFDKNSTIKRHEHALKVMKTLGKDFIRIKHDGSLAGTSGSQGPGLGGEFGFEIVTGPCDLQTHRENWPRLVVAENYRKLRAWDTNTCGFHVHVDRSSLTTFQISRMVMFANHPNNKSFIQKIAGRSEEKYCKYFPKKASDVLHPENGDYNERRRVAINLQNEKTVEFRIFRGTINPKHIIRNLEFCDALCDFCHPASRSLQDNMDPFKFIEFVAKERTFIIVDKKVVKVKKWPLLYAWFEHHKAIKKRLRKGEKEEVAVDEEAGPSQKYVLPQVLVEHSIGIKPTNPLAVCA